MGNIVMMMSVSLDGYFEGPDREIDWHQVDDEVHAYVNEKLSRAGGFLDGRRTFELMDDYWPTADQDPAARPVVVEFARIWRDMPKVVYSRTLDHADGNTTVAREVVPAKVLALKEKSAGDLFVGGAELAGTFLHHDLIDEFHFYLNPIILGRGHPAFPLQDRRIELELRETRTFGNGLVLLRYGRAA
jgi:dihydrofolate reductase